MEADSRSRGSTETRMSVAMKREQMGSAISQPNCSTSMEDMMTPTLPIVSASTCRNPPAGMGGWVGGKGKEGDQNGLKE